MPRESCRGFTLIELLVVVAIIAIVAAVAIPHLMNATQKGRQSGTLGDMRAMVTALGDYAIDVGRYPAASNVTDLSVALEPDYITKLPMTDAWGYPFLYEREEDGKSYVLRSPGSDGVEQSTPPKGASHAFEDDIICVDGSFVQWPAGRQR